jgi:hypothetical protein
MAETVEKSVRRQERYVVRIYSGNRGSFHDQFRKHSMRWKKMLMDTIRRHMCIRCGNNTDTPRYLVERYEKLFVHENAKITKHVGGCKHRSRLGYLVSSNE